MKQYGALFDLDGVLIDSETAYTEFWSGIDRIYPTGIDDYAIYIKGTTLTEIMKHYSDEEVKADILRRIDEFQHSMAFTLFAGVERFLSGLKERGIPSAIVTSSDERKMERLFRQHPSFRNYFDVVIDASQVTRSKPDPQGYLLAAEAIGRDPHDCFVFEDSLQGIKAGNAAGATVIALATTYPEEALKGKAARIIGGFEGFTIDDMLSLKC